MSKKARAGTAVANVRRLPNMSIENRDQRQARVNPIPVATPQTHIGMRTKADW
jgi:hypothetical protein